MDPEFQLLVVDTNTVVRLNAKSSSAFGSETRELIRNGVLLIPAIVELELNYLYEIGRFNYPGREQVARVLEDYASSLDLTNLSILAKESSKFKWTRDPFDRLIMATSRVNNAKLLTTDRELVANYELAWDTTN